MCTVWPVAILVGSPSRAGRSCRWIPKIKLCGGSPSRAWRNYFQDMPPARHHRTTLARGEDATPHTCVYLDRWDHPPTQGGTMVCLISWMLG